MAGRAKTLVLWCALVALFLGLYELSRDEPRPRAGFDTFLAHLEGGLVAEVRAQDNQIDVDLFDGTRYTTLGVVDDELTRRLSEAGVRVQWGEEKRPLRTLLVTAVPVLVFLALFVYFLRKQQGNAGNVLSLRRSRARLLEGEVGVTFADVGGCEEAKAQLGDVIDFLKHPQRWSGAGVRLPRGVLLEGPPGCGKTLLARAVAGETDAKFYLVSASEFVELFVGVGASRVRDMFETAQKNAPAVIFIDELDAIGRRRGSGIGAGHDEREQTLNQILVCMDGFEAPERVVVIGATNRADVLDAALTRPGRFDRRVHIPPLDREQRQRVLEIHTGTKKLAAEVSLSELAARTEGFSGADLENLANEAGLLAVRRARQAGGEPVLGPEDFEQALRPSRERAQRFDQLDALLIESTSQLSQPSGRARVRLTLREGSVVEGDLVWADASFVKLRREGEAGDTIVPKRQIKTLEPLDGTEPAADVTPDAWARRLHDMAG
jgi:cell division protease FtsH